MNYLAHLALSGKEEEIIAGNYMGDSLKGVDVRTFSEGIQKGIQLHRFIDDFTDHHPVFIQTKKIFSPRFDKYSGALTDIFFDHFLALNFTDHHTEELQHFAFNKYQVLGKYYFLYPEKAKMFYQYMVQNNVLVRYAEKAGIKQVLEGMTHRIGYRAPLHDAMDELEQNYLQLEQYFGEFYLELKEKSARLLLSH